MVYTFEGVSQMAERLSGLLASDMKRFDRTLYPTHRHEAKAAATVSAVRSPSEEQSAERSPELGMPLGKERFPVREYRRGNVPAPAAGGVFDLFGQGNLFAQPVQEELSPEEHRHRHEEFLARQQQTLEPRPLYGQGAASLPQRHPRRTGGTVRAFEGYKQETTDVPPSALKHAQRFRAEAHLPLRDTYHQLSTGWSPQRNRIQGLRRKLGRLYDNFVRTVGDLNGKENAKLILPGCHRPRNTVARTLRER